MINKKAQTLSLYQIMEQYPDNNSAILYFQKMLWGNKTVCVKCGCYNKITEQKKFGDFWCGDCRSYFNVFTNTPLERSKVDVRKWIYASYTLLTSRKGISSLQLCKELGVQQRTAWYMLHRLRIACGDELVALSGEVEVDETYIGGKEKNKHFNKQVNHSQGGANKVIVMGMKERGGRVKAMTIQNADKNTLQGNIAEHVQVGSTVYTDDHRGYTGLGGLFYKHHSVNHSAKEYVNGMAHTNSIESVWAVLKRGYNGTYHNWSVKHCQQYVNEFTFRLNEGNVKIDTQDRIDSLFRKMSGKTITYNGLVA